MTDVTQLLQQIEHGDPAGEIRILGCVAGEEYASFRARQAVRHFSQSSRRTTASAHTAAVEIAVNVTCIGH